MRLYRTADRYYCVAVQRDLFSDPVIVRWWGGIHNRLGGMATEPLVPGRLAAIDKERRAHGYDRVAGS